MYTFMLSLLQYNCENLVVLYLWIVFDLVKKEVIFFMENELPWLTLCSPTSLVEFDFYTQPSYSQPRPVQPAPSAFYQFGGQLSRALEQSTFERQGEEPVPMEIESVYSGLDPEQVLREEERQKFERFRQRREFLKKQRQEKRAEAAAEQERLIEEEKQRARIERERERQFSEIRKQEELARQRQVEEEQERKRQMIIQQQIQEEERRRRELQETQERERKFREEQKQLEEERSRRLALLEQEKQRQLQIQLERQRQLHQEEQRRREIEIEQRRAEEEEKKRRQAPRQVAQVSVPVAQRLSCPSGQIFVPTNPEFKAFACTPEAQATVARTAFMNLPPEASSFAVATKWSTESNRLASEPAMTQDVAAMRWNVLNNLNKSKALTALYARPNVPPEQCSNVRSWSRIDANTPGVLYYRNQVPLSVTYDPKRRPIIKSPSGKAQPIDWGHLAEQVEQMATAP